jgi:hypothetical protein
MPKLLAMKNLEVKVQVFCDLSSLNVLDRNEKLALSSIWEFPSELQVPE